MKTLRVSDLASKASVSSGTIRFYEKQGLLPEPPRSSSGYREYDGTALERIEFIKAGQALGMRLTDIKELCDIRDHGRCPCGHTTQVLDRRIVEVEEEIERLVRLKNNLTDMKNSAIDGKYEWCCPTDERSQ
ncbi:MAG: MerR family transcriptional regulator [Actinomycetota bacterium]